MLSGLHATDSGEAAAAALVLSIEDGGDSKSSLFVARFLLRPPNATLRSGGGGSCALKATSADLLQHEELLSWLCVTGRTYLLLKECSEMHPQYGPCCFAEIMYLVTLILSWCCTWTGGLLLVRWIWGIGPSETAQSPAAGIAFFLVAMCPLGSAHMVRHKLEQRSELRSVAVQTFHSDLQLRVTQLAKRLHPVGFIISTKERDGGILEVVIEKSCEWNGDGALLIPSTSTSRAKNVLSEVDINSIRFGQHFYLTANTPLDIWLLGGLMLYRAQTTKRNRAWKGIIDAMSPLLEERFGYTMKYEIRPGWLPNTTKGTIQFQDAMTNDVLCPKKQSTVLHVTRRTTTTTRSSNAQVQTV
jgi:hypothetical protein